MARLSKESFEKEQGAAAPEPGNVIKVGMGSCGVAAGAEEVFQVMLKETKERNLPVTVKKCGCQGMCYAEPLVEVSVEGLPTVTYGRVTREVAVKILEKHVCNKMLVNDCIFDFNT